MGKSAKGGSKPLNVASNHNTLDPAKPVPVATITDPDEAKPDYNPMRAPGGFANVQSDTSLNRDDNDSIVEAKGDRATAEEVELDPKVDVADKTEAGEEAKLKAGGFFTGGKK